MDFACQSFCVAGMAIRSLQSVLRRIRSLTLTHMKPALGSRERGGRQHVTHRPFASGQLPALFGSKSPQKLFSPTRHPGKQFNGSTMSRANPVSARSRRAHSPVSCSPRTRTPHLRSSSASTALRFSQIAMAGSSH